MSKSAARIKEVRIDPTACVHPTAELAPGVEIGPFTVIGEGVRIGENTKIGSHVVIDKWTAIGKNNSIFQFVSIGAPPQDLGYKGERTETIIGDNNTIREFVTIHRATTKDKLRTECGSNNLFMNYVHIAHDCQLGDNIIMANSATLGGHVRIDNNAIVGGLVAVHQYVRIGAYCIIGGASAVSKDIPPYVMAVGNRASVYRLNAVGIRRQGFSKEELGEIKRSYNIIFRSSLSTSDAVEELKKELPGSVHARRFVDFIHGSKRGIARERMKRKGDLSEED
ncbi:MAG TPA: acyl-[acyl-carrier-protein]--UDP-N-acetylglucosamine O-acyltransferase [Deltaproteobacteria bacterium]|nr:MAG: acyl-[acyl-carrier-protein]--UDP-N-acetylglucosamine O-acyltransferase [Deltaproteobacteria bacterium GWA2_55_82]OGQ64269.1 MAG: acyl-[acyl-carrier-protein]--UDP-N-acetylglucosamine O-acyltransferase [Deltaproteobacteria bacterium RIFCSPLOWO2_02_FULL_55_12]OIJ73988.1 MAG: acyl-[acyl-carrier-protein]--UDP-N-acetylglucosamine O-acyltransferase [Deltaproteobacteria bacterium GWC2_55_46]HBG46590.1 acyl-[acyl-carrier-protein]--UDP-N-acetylglucosamine O-acyltransferase [Deltaproteobacteria bac